MSSVCPKYIFVCRTFHKTLLQCVPRKPHTSIDLPNKCQSGGCDHVTFATTCWKVQACDFTLITRNLFMVPGHRSRTGSSKLDSIKHHLAGTQIDLSALQQLIERATRKLLILVHILAKCSTRLTKLLGYILW